MTVVTLSPSGNNVQTIHGDDSGAEERDKLLQAYLEYVQARGYCDREPLSASTPLSARM
jgi:hypothetical protein